MTIYDRGGYQSQTGLMVDGYKEGKWTNKRYKKTSYSFYKKDVLVKTIEHKNVYRTKVPYTETKYYSGTYPQTISQIDSSTTELLAIHKTVAKIRRNRGLHEYHITKPYVNQNLLKATNGISLVNALEDVNKEFRTQYNDDLIVELPTIDSIELNKVGRIQSFVLKWKKLSITFLKGENDTYVNDNHFNINWRQLKQHFYLGKNTFSVQKNGVKWFTYSFNKAMPSAFKSYYLNGNTKLTCQFKNGFLDQTFLLKDRKGKTKIVCFFNEGIIQGELTHYNLNRELVLTAPYTDGRLNGWVIGKYYELEYLNGQRKKYIKKNDQNEIVSWSMYNNSSMEKYKCVESRINGVVKQIRDKDGFLQQIACNTENFSFSYHYYPSQDIVSFGYAEGPNNKRNSFHLYTTKKGDVKEKNISIYRNGIPSHNVKKQKAVQEINKKYFNLYNIDINKPVKRTKTSKGSLTQLTYYYPNGAVLLTESLQDGMLHGERKLYSLSGQVMQVANYKNNIPHGEYIAYTITGLPFEKGTYTNGEKTGVWTSKKGLDYVYEYDDKGKLTYMSYSTFTGKLRQEYFYPPEGEYYIKYDTLSGKVESEYKKNKNGKQHGTCYFKYKGTQIYGNYLNGYKHGKWQDFDLEGRLVKTYFYDYGREVQNPVDIDPDACECKSEFNPKNGSIYFPSINDFYSFHEFNEVLNDHLIISESMHKRSFYGGFYNSHSHNNTTVNNSMYLVSLKNDYHFGFKDHPTKLYLMPCLKSGEIGKRDINFYAYKPLEGFYNIDKDEFTSSSKHYFDLLTSIIEQMDFEDYLEQTFDEDEIEKLYKLLKKENLPLPQKETKLASIISYWYDEDDGEFWELIYKTYFNDGMLNENEKGYNEFQQSMIRLFGNATNIYSIKTLEKNYIIPTYQTTLGKGRYSIENPLLVYDNKPAKIAFDCKGIDIKENLLFNDISNVCHHKDITVKGTDINKISISTININKNYSEQDYNGLVLSGTSRLPNIKQDLPTKFVINKEGIWIHINVESVNPELLSINRAQQQWTHHLVKKEMSRFVRY